MANIQTFVINLDRAHSRMQAIANQLNALAIPFQRISAIDGHHLTTDQLGCFDPLAFHKKHGMTVTNGEIGCYLSHLLAIQAFVNSDADFALILEDDVIITDKLPAALIGVTAHTDQWDMVKLSAIHSGTPYRYLEISTGQWLCIMLSRCTGASAYLINRKAAQNYLAQLLPMSLPYDHAFDRGWDLRIKVRLLSPTPCIHDNQIESTIGFLDPSRKFHWSRRIPTYIYRLKNELQRVFYGLKSIFILLFSKPKLAVSTPFSDFIRNASSEEKARVYAQVLEKSAGRQNALLREVEKSDPQTKQQ